MFVKRDDGLGCAFVPFHIAALLLAALWTVCCGVRGWWAVPAFVGLYAASFLALFVLFYVVVWLFSLTIDTKSPPPEEDHPFVRKIVLVVISHLCRFARLRLHTEGLEKLPEGRFLVVSNHLSAYDPITAVWALRKTTTAFITKPENHRIPLAGPLIYRTNFLPINREDPREAMRTINAAANLLKNDVVSVGVYPEGTRNRTPEQGFLPFHNGVFKIAQKAGTPVVVATVHGTECIGKNFPWRHTDVHIHICETIPAAEIGGSTAALSERVQNVMARDLAGK